MDTVATDDDLTRARVELGEPDAVFHVGRGRFLAKVGLAVLLLLYGVAANYLWWVHGPGTFGHLELLLLVVVPLSGFVLLWHLYRSRGLHVLVYPSGLLRLRRGEVDSFPWAEVGEVRLRVRRADAPELVRGPDGLPTVCRLPAEVPAFQLWSAGLTVTRADGAEAQFGAVLGEYDRLAEEVQRRTFPRLWAAAWGRFAAGEPVAFGDLEVRPDGLRAGGKLLPWPGLTELTVAQGRLAVKQAGRWLPWLLLDMAAVPNPHVLFALVDEARRRAAPPPAPAGGADPV